MVEVVTWVVVAENVMALTVAGTLGGLWLWLWCGNRKDAKRE